MTKVTTPEGGEIKYRYNTTHNLIATVMPTGRTTYYLYDMDLDAVTAISQTNGVANGNFEMNADANHLPDLIDYEAGEPVVALDAASGSPYGQAIKVNAQSTNSYSYSVYMSRKISVDPTKPYTVSAYVKAAQTSGEQNTILSLQAYDGNDNLLSEVDAANRVTEKGAFGWKRVKKSYATLPAGTVNVRVKMASTNGTGSGTSWFDAVQLEQQTDAGEFISGTQYTTNAGTMQAASYDGEGKKKLYNYNKDQNMIKLQYDPAGMNLTESYGWNDNEISSKTDPMNNTWSYQYQNGKPTYTKNPLGDEEWNTYDADMNLVAHQGLRGTKEKSYFTYDSGRHQKTARDPYFTSQAKEHDVHGNLTSETNFLGWADNLVDNSSFESAANADGTPARFAFNAGQQNVWSHSTDAVYGKQSIQLNLDSPGYTVLVSDLVAVNRSAEYVLSGYLKASESSGGQNTVFSVLAYDATGAYIGEAGRISINGVQDWKRWNTAIRAGDFPAGTVKVRVKVAAANSSGTGSSFFDAVQLQQNPVDTGYNYLDNSSFERGVTSATVPEFWEKTPLTGTYNWVNEASGVGTDVYAGSRALSVATTSDTTGSTGYNYQQYIPYDPTKSYSLSAFVKTTSGANATLKIALFDSNKNLLKAVSNSQIGKSDWKRLNVDLTPEQAAPGTAYLKPLLRTASTTGTVSFDNIRFQNDKTTTEYKYAPNSSWVVEVKNAQGHKSVNEYDTSGNVTKITSPRSFVTTKTYDAMNRLNSVVWPGNSLTTFYGYDREGNQTTLKEKDAVSEKEVKMTYNARNQLASVTNPLARQSSFSYTANGQLKQKTLADGRTISYGYDKANRMTDVYLEGKKRIQYLDIDGNGNIKTIKGLKEDSSVAYTWSGRFDALNRLTYWSDGAGETTYSYDEVGNVTQKLFKVTGSTNSKTEWYSYNLVNQPIAMTDANGDPIRFLFNEHNQLSMLKKANGSVMTAEYNNVGQLTEMRNHTADGSLDSSFTYLYDAEGNITSVADQDGKVWTYTYSPRGELLIEAVFESVTTYTYDAFGNRTDRVEKLADGTEEKTTYQYDQANQVVSVNGTAWTYDQNGHLISNGKHKFAWDTAGRLTSVRNFLDDSVVAAYQYDHLGRRVKEESDGHVKQFFYDGSSNRVVAEFVDNQLGNYYTWSPTGQLLSITNNSGGTYYTFTNKRGDILKLTDASGNIVATYEYDSWGRLLSESGETSSLNPYMFAGYRYDRNTGLYYLNARYYDPAVGTFLSPDPAYHMPDYSYSHNNPITYVDPSGLKSGEPEIGGGPTSASTPGNPNVGRGLGVWLSNLFKRYGDDAAEAVTELTVDSLEIYGPPIPPILQEGPANTDVYIGEKNGVNDYVGISVDWEKRKQQHGDRFTDVSLLTNVPVTRKQARAIEQALIYLNPQFSNKINSISPKRNWHDGAVAWGIRWLAKNGYFENK